jgi:uncharacterized metal-binding protein
MNEKKQVCLVFVCSGASDVGELADRAAREMARRGLAAMSCLAGIGARDPDILFNAEAADRVLLIDGCPQACGRRAFKFVGLRRFEHFDLSEAGFVKGDSPVSDHRVQVVVEQAMKLLRTRRQGSP